MRSRRRRRACGRGWHGAPPAVRRAKGKFTPDAAGRPARRPRLQQQAGAEAEQRGLKAEREVDRHRADEVQLRRADGQVEALHEDGEEQRRRAGCAERAALAQELRRLGGDERHGSEVGGDDLGAGKIPGSMCMALPRVHGTTMRTTRRGRQALAGTGGRRTDAAKPRTYPARQCLMTLHDESAGASGARGQPAENQSDRTHTQGSHQPGTSHGAVFTAAARFRTRSQAGLLARRLPPPPTFPSARLQWRDGGFVRLTAGGLRRNGRARARRTTSPDFPFHLVAEDMTRHPDRMRGEG